MNKNSPKSLKLLEKELNFHFLNSDLLTEALTHSSLRKRKVILQSNNERLEFLGDSVLKLITSEALFSLYPTKNEGELSKIRSRLISDKFLAKLAKEINLGTYLRMSFGEKKSGGVTKESNLANCLEAILGACYLDQGVQKTTQMYLSLLGSIEKRIDSDESYDYKSNLQELSQKSYATLPTYKLINTTGPEHDKKFYVEASLHTDEFIISVKGSGKTKKDAEQVAACELLKQVNLLKH